MGRRSRHDAEPGTRSALGMPNRSKSSSLTRRLCCREGERMKARLAFPAVFLLAGCAAVGNQSGRELGRTSHCAPRRSARPRLGLGGPEAIGAAYLFGALSATAARGHVRRSRRPRRTGSALYAEWCRGVDSGECRIIVRDRMGKVAHITYHYDFSFPTPGRWREAESCDGLAGSGPTHTTGVLHPGPMR